MAMPTYTTRLLEKVPRVDDIVSFRWERPPGYTYQAGQWFVITFPRTPDSGGPGSRGGLAEQADEPYTHHFSHSNSPLDSVLEFTTRLRGSEFKNALDALPVGTEIEVEGPYGSFTLPPAVERVAFLTGGIGITCVRSILRWLGQTAAVARPKEIVLLFANRSEEAIPFRDELEDLARSLPLRLVNVLSRPGEGWTGRSGHIDSGVLSEELQDPSGWAFYLSGPPSLGEAMGQLLLEWGAGQNDIHTERFEGYE